MVCIHLHYLNCSFWLPEFLPGLRQFCAVLQMGTHLHLALSLSLPLSFFAKIPISDRIKIQNVKTVTIYLTEDSDIPGLLDYKPTIDSYFFSGKKKWRCQARRCTWKMCVTLFLFPITVVWIKSDEFPINGPVTDTLRCRCNYILSNSSV